MTDRLPPLATRANERLIANPSRLGGIDRIVSGKPDAWQLELPDLGSLPKGEGPRRNIRICIATEDIVGPVRNGGIGTTYAALAELLAGEGHDTTVLYLGGTRVENETAEHWIHVYAEKGVKLVPVPNYAASEHVSAGAPQWFAPMYNMYRYLSEHPFDVVHVSEWRGSAYLSLLAKRQGLGLQDTLFIVKTSSPWLWNRLYGSLPLEQAPELAKTVAERRSVELADMVVGGSLHLIRWMETQGYDVPRRRSYVQPNVVRFDHLRGLMGKRAHAPGARIPIDEIVFFGRLEARKGLMTFCQAIRRLIRRGHKLPQRIAFMGKRGARLGVRGRQTAIDYIAEETADWPCEVLVHTEFQQYEALDYLLSGSRLAVMPSTIENSSLAVYEAAICRIPFVASLAGGTPELIAGQDHDKVLCDPHPIPLAALIADAIDNGGYIASPSFDNESNLATWIAFHDSLARGLASELNARAQRETSPASPSVRSVDVCIYSRGDEELLRRTVGSLAVQSLQPACVRVAIDAVDVEAAAGSARRLLDEAGLRAESLDALDYDLGLAYNALSGRCDATYLLFLEEGATIEPEALDVLSSVASRRNADVLTYFYRTSSGDDRRDGPTVAELIGSPSEAFFSPRPVEIPLFVRRETFERLEGFTSDYRVLLHERELVAKAILSGARCETVPKPLGTLRERTTEWLDMEGYDASAAEFRTIRPFLGAAPMALNEILLMAKGQQRLLAAAGMERSGTRETRAGGKAQIRRVEPDVALFTGWGGRCEHGDAGLEGRVLDAADGTVIGWVRDPADPARELIIEAWADGKRIGCAPAREPLDLACAVPERVRMSGFKLSLGGVGKLPWRRQDAIKVDIRTSGGVVLAEGLELRSPGASVRQSRLVGHCDPNDSGAVAGWLWDPAAPHRAVELTVYIDGRFYHRLAASNPRDDLLAAGIGTGSYGFSVNLPSACFDGRPHTVDVLVADRGLRLIGAPLSVLAGSGGSNGRPVLRTKTDHGFDRARWMWGRSGA